MKLCLVFLGALLFAFHLGSQVQAQTATVSSKNTTMTAAVTPRVNTTVPLKSTTAVNVTQDNGCGRTEASLVLLPLALVVLLHGWP